LFTSPGSSALNPLVFGSSERSTPEPEPATDHHAPSVYRPLMRTNTNERRDTTLDISSSFSSFFDSPNKSTTAAKHASLLTSPSSDNLSTNLVTSIADARNLLSAPADLDVIEPASDPRGLRQPLYHHQRIALAWMRNAEAGPNKGGILADDMGMGKTISTISLVLDRLGPSSNKESLLTPFILYRKFIATGN